MLLQTCFRLDTLQKCQMQLEECMESVVGTRAHSMLLSGKGGGCCIQEVRHYIKHVRCNNSATLVRYILSVSHDCKVNSESDFENDLKSIRFLEYLLPASWQKTPS